MSLLSHALELSMFATMSADSDSAMVSGGDSLETFRGQERDNPGLFFQHQERIRHPKRWQK